MKKFLLTFFIPTISVFLIVVGVFTIRANNFSFKLPEDKKILFIGDSHFEFGIDESIIPNAYNWGCRGDPYLNQYLRLKKILHDDQEIKVVFISVNPWALPHDGYFLSKKNFPGRIRRYVPFYRFEELKTYICNMSIRSGAYGEFAKEVLLGSAESWFISEDELMHNMGRFEDLEIKNLKKDVDGGFSVRSSTWEWHNDSTIYARYPHKIVWDDSIQIRYLHKIVDLANAENIRLVFVNTPIYKAEKYFDMKLFYSIIQNQFSSVEFWDYANLKFDSFNLMMDIDHLNKWGAEEFSKVLAERMKREGIITE